MDLFQPVTHSTYSRGRPKQFKTHVDAKFGACSAFLEEIAIELRLYKKAGKKLYTVDRCFILKYNCSMKHIKNKNPLKGKAHFDEDGNLWISKNIKFGGELNPKIKPREWFYLVIESCKEKEFSKSKVNNFIISTLGSRPTQWRTKKSLIKKGYL